MNKANENWFPGADDAVHVKFPVVVCPVSGLKIFCAANTLQPLTSVPVAPDGPATPRASLICQLKFWVPPGPMVNAPLDDRPGLLPAWTLPPFCVTTLTKFVPGPLVQGPVVHDHAAAADAVSHEPVVHEQAAGHHQVLAVQVHARDVLRRVDAGVPMNVWLPALKANGDEPVFVNNVRCGVVAGVRSQHPIRLEVGDVDLAAGPDCEGAAARVRERIEIRNRAGVARVDPGGTVKLPPLTKLMNRSLGLLDVMVTEGKLVPLANRDPLTGSVANVPEPPEETAGDHSAVDRQGRARFDGQRAPAQCVRLGSRRIGRITQSCQVVSVTGPLPVDASLEMARVPSNTVVPPE